MGKDEKETIARWVSVFRENVVAQTDAIWNRGHHGNEHARRYIRALGKLREIGDTGRDALGVLLNDIRPDVRVATAAFLLRYKHEQAMGVLREAAKGKGMVSFEAGEAIKRWNEGAWQLDPE